MTEHATHHGSEEQFDQEIQVKPIVWTGLGLLIISIISMVIVWWMSVGLKSYFQGQDPAPSPLAEVNQTGLPPTPRLQPMPVEEGFFGPNSAPGAGPEAQYQQMLAEMHEKTTTYAWVDKAEGKVRIPVERALELVAAQGDAAMTVDLAQPAEVDASASEEADGL